MQSGKPFTMTRASDAAHKVDEFSVASLVNLNPEASVADVASLALARTEHLHDLVTAVACFESGVIWEPYRIAELFVPTVEDVRLLLTALQTMTQPEKPQEPEPDA